MTPLENTAESLIRVYLDGRMMPRVLQDAVVWVVTSRLTRGEEPVLEIAQARPRCCARLFGKALIQSVMVPAPRPTTTSPDLATDAMVSTKA